MPDPMVDIQPGIDCAMVIDPLGTSGSSKSPLITMFAKLGAAKASARGRDRRKTRMLFLFWQGPCGYALTDGRLDSWWAHRVVMMLPLLLTGLRCSSHLRGGRPAGRGPNGSGGTPCAGPRDPPKIRTMGTTYPD